MLSAFCGLYRARTMVDLKEQRISMIFCFDMEEAVSEAYEELKNVIHDAAMNRIQTFKGIHILKVTKFC
jgi:hypothetical protein